MFAQNSTQIAITNSNWVATDALGRKIADYSQTGNIKPNKYVGIFHYIWHNGHGHKVNDVSKVLAANPYNPKFKRGATYYWGEPEAGYYNASDPYIIRRNMLMLVNTGIDFIYIDLTNAYIYLKSGLEPLLKVSSQMRSEGIPTPYFVATTHTQSGKTMNLLYDSIYAKNKYKNYGFTGKENL